MAKRNDLLVRLGELARLFLKLGTIAFGGPAAHIAIMEDEVVRRRRWLTHDEFLDLLGATNLIPGPNSTEMAIHIGHRRAGVWGLLTAGTCFIVPAMLIVLGCGWAYVNYGKLPEVEAVTLWSEASHYRRRCAGARGLGKSALKSKFLVAIAVAGSAAALMQVNEFLILFASGLVTALWRRPVRKGKAAYSVFPLIGFKPVFAAAPLAGAVASSAPFAFWPLFLFFTKVGSVLYGSGYVLLAFLRSGLVERFGWLTETQLLDAVAVGQITPGPVFTTATFIGYILGGTPAALVATAGIFLPAFIFVALSGPLIPLLRRSAVAGAFLDGVNVSSLALMFVVTLALGRVAILDWWTVGLAAFAAFLLFRYRVNSAWLVGEGAMIGLLVRH